jgi:hypothetical protein
VVAPRIAGESEAKCCIRSAGIRSSSALNSPTANRKQKQLRIALVAFAALLALQSIWITLPELIRPSPLAFPREPGSPEISAFERDRATRAAELALVRGDLWAEAAIAQSSEQTAKSVESARTAPSIERAQAARAVAEKATTLSPHDSRIWLLLASQDCLLHRETSGALKMSYYTGPDEVVLMPPRLLVATCSDTINDSELQTFVAGEIRLILTHERHLKPAIVAAYKNATPRGRRLIEAVVGDLDSGLMATIRANRTTE